MSPDSKPNIVLVHGAWADGSSWSGVIERLQADGYTVTAPQFPLTSLADDIAKLRHVLALQEGPTVAAGHSYGGQVITALGTDAPNLIGLVYIAAFGLDEGESLAELLAQGPPTPALEHQFVDSEGLVWLPSWYMVAQEDQAIPPDAERMFADRMGASTVEVAAGHLPMVSHPAEVANLTETAAAAAPAVNAIG